MFLENELKISSFWIWFWSSLLYFHVCVGFEIIGFWRNNAHLNKSSGIKLERTIKQLPWIVSDLCWDRFQFVSEDVKVKGEDFSCMVGGWDWYERKLLILWLYFVTWFGNDPDKVVSGNFSWLLFVWSPFVVRLFEKDLWERVG